ncbi:MAG: hypothetical protein ABIG80_01875 [Patescibacteria group bacterium]
MNSQSTTETNVLPTKKIEYPQLKKIGGFKNFSKKVLVKTVIIVLTATLAGYLAGYLMQQNFRELTGYKYDQTATIELEANEAVMRPTNTRFQKDGNLFIHILSDTINMTTNALTVVKNSEIIQAANQASLSIILTILSPLFWILDWVAFWLPFTLVFVGAAWLTNKLITLKSQVISNGLDPQLLKNVELLEAKVKELVDHANQNPKS